MRIIQMRLNLRPQYLLLPSKSVLVLQNHITYHTRHRAIIIVTETNQTLFSKLSLANEIMKADQSSDSPTFWAAPQPSWLLHVHEVNSQWTIVQIISNIVLFALYTLRSYIFEICCEKMWLVNEIMFKCSI